MRILVIGNSHAARIFSNLFCKNEKNIVFTTVENSAANFVDHGSLCVEHLLEFALANEINLTVLCDFESLDVGFVETFSDAGLTVFAPESGTGGASGASRICSSKSYAKKFMYKNKIKTPRFQIFDKPQLALDWVVHRGGGAGKSNYPLVIKPNAHSETYGTTVCETFAAAQKTINEFFALGSKSIVIEEFVSGREFSAYVITDGFNAFLLDFVSTKLNRFAYLGSNFVDEELKNKVMTNVIATTIENLANAGSDYIGVLGVDFILTEGGELYTLEYNPFFENLDAELFARGLDEPFETMFDSAISGTLRDEFSKIKKHSGNFIGAITKDSNIGTGRIISAEGRTLNEARENLLEEIEDEETAKEVRNWKF